MKVKTIISTLLFTILGLFAIPSFAVVDVTAATTAITTDGTTAITAVGGALLALAGVAVVIKWAKASIFG